MDNFTRIDLMYILVFGFSICLLRWFQAVLANSVEVKECNACSFKMGNNKMIDGMVDHGLKNLLRLAVEEADYEQVEMMLTHHGVEGEDVLRLAVEKGDYKMVK
ncbi:hypothetical protein B0O99DRAFT_646161 [Bisporella sp. PMI_857]|nr:hypothetical protein B0O99DRAFT_646161 [Bisporella sp. PMI_857]